MPSRVVFREPNMNRFPIHSSSPDSTRSVNSPTATGLRISRRTEDLVRRSREMASDDISASTLLSGYLFIFTAYCVLFVSTIKMKQQGSSGEDSPMLEQWKLDSVLYGSLAFIVAVFFLVAFHFDAFFCPNFSRNLFKNGSMGEFSILVFLLFSAFFMLYVSTSTTGPGGFTQLNYNVFFSAWAGLIAVSHTLDLWLVGKGKDSVGDFLRKSPVKTNYNWTLTLFFSVVTLLSLLDTFLQSKLLAKKNALIMVISSSCSAGCCVFALMMNFMFRPPQDSHWHKILKAVEGILLIAICSFWTWVVFRFTGINGLVNGPSNSYFGVWGSFFYSISTLGVWTKKEHWRGS